MFLLPPRKFLLSPSSKSGRIILMGSKNFLLSSATPTIYACIHSLHDCSSSPRTLYFDAYSRKNSRLFSSPKHLRQSNQRSSGYSYTPYSAMPVPKPINGVDVETLEKQFVDDKKLMILRKKLQEIGIDGSSCMPGQYNGLVCPSCKGGESHEKSLSLNITEDGGAAIWTCFRAKCGWKGTTRAYAGVKSTYGPMNKTMKTKQPTRIITEESLGLEPLCSEMEAPLESEEGTKPWQVYVRRKRRDRVEGSGA